MITFYDLSSPDSGSKMVVWPSLRLDKHGTVSNGIWYTVYRHNPWFLILIVKKAVKVLFESFCFFVRLSQLFWKQRTVCMAMSFGCNSFVVSDLVRYAIFFARLRFIFRFDCNCILKLASKKYFFCYFLNQLKVSECWRD